MYRSPVPTAIGPRGGHGGRRLAAWSTVVVLMASCGAGPGADAFQPSAPPDETGTVVADPSTSDISPLDRVFGTDTTVIVASEPPVAPTTLAANPCAGATTAAQAAAAPFRVSELIGAGIVAESGRCGPRVVIEFEATGDIPGWVAGYVEDPVADSLVSRDVSLAGEATLTISMVAWMGVFGVGYTGPNDIVVDDVAGLRELRLIANEDGASTWAVGVDAEVPFTVTEETDPPRIIVQFVPLG